FGTYDDAQLQRGLKIYVENCSACHALSRVSFRNLADLGYSEDQIKSFAAGYEVEDGPNMDGEMFFRAATPADQFPSPFPNREAAIAAMGAYPPDMSLLAKARAVTRGFPTFVFDIFTQYAESGPDYIYSLLTGYGKEPPEGSNIPDTLHYNPYFIAGEALAMAQPLYDDGITYDDGTPATISQQAKDVSAFLMWAAEPKLEERKQTGFKVMVFLLVFAVFLYLSKKQVWSRVEH
ncbi:MAG: cytochrome c1, partial [Ahrensia sp.]